jgi:hypothetical protein
MIATVFLPAASAVPTDTVYIRAALQAHAVIMELVKLDNLDHIATALDLLERVEAGDAGLVGAAFTAAADIDWVSEDQIRAALAALVKEVG